MLIDEEATIANGGNKVCKSITPIIEIGLKLFKDKEVDLLRKIHRDINIINKKS